MVTKLQIEKTAVYLLFSLFIQFSAIETRWVFSHAKLMISWLQRLEKKRGVPVLVGELQPFFNWQSSISRQFCHVFNVRVLNDTINYAQKGCAMQKWGITLKCKVFNVTYLVQDSHFLLFWQLFCYCMVSFNTGLHMETFWLWLSSSVLTVIKSHQTLYKGQN